MQGHSSECPHTEQNTYLEVWPLVHCLNARNGMDRDPWKNIDIGDAELALPGASKPFPTSETNVQHSIETLRLVDIAFSTESAESVCGRCVKCDRVRLIA